MNCPVSFSPASQFAAQVRITPQLRNALVRANQTGERCTLRLGPGNALFVGPQEFQIQVNREERSCDLYSLTDGLHQSGCCHVANVRQKIHVQMVLTEEEKLRNRTRGEEAERRQKGRKALVIDHASRQDVQRRVVVPQSKAKLSNQPRPSTHKPGRLKSYNITLPLPRGCGAGRPVTKPESRHTSASVQNPRPELGAGTISRTQQTEVAAVNRTAAPSMPRMQQVPRPAQVPPTGGKPIQQSQLRLLNKIAKGPAAAGAKKRKQAQEAVVRPPPSDLVVAAMRKGGCTLCIKALLSEAPLGLTRKALENKVRDAAAALGNSEEPRQPQVEKALQEVAQFKPPGKYYLQDFVSTIDVEELRHSAGNKHNADLKAALAGTAKRQKHDAVPRKVQRSYFELEATEDDEQRAFVRGTTASAAPEGGRTAVLQGVVVSNGLPEADPSSGPPDRSGQSTQSRGTTSAGALDRIKTYQQFVTTYDDFNKDFATYQALLKDLEARKQAYGQLEKLASVARSVDGRVQGYKKIYDTWLEESGNLSALNEKLLSAHVSLGQKKLRLREYVKTYEPPNS